MIKGYLNPSVRINGFGFEYQEINLTKLKNQCKPLISKLLIMVESK